jgi:hypothetical protein
MQVVIVVEVQRYPMGVGSAGDHVDESGAKLQTTFGDSVMVQFVLRFNWSMQGDAIERARKLVGIDLPVLVVKALLEQQTSNMNATVLKR